MTIDDLVKVFRSKAWPIPVKDGGEGSDREGVIAIVRALRDETRHMTLNRDSLEELFTQILGDAGEKVAGGSSRDASKATEASGARCATPCASAPATDPIRDAVAMARGRVLVVDDIPMLNKLAAAMKPATAAAPAVCVWNPNAKGWWVASCDKRYSFRKSALSKLSECPECNAPIKFTEAK